MHIPPLAGTKRLEGRPPEPLPPKEEIIYSFAFGKSLEARNDGAIVVWQCSADDAILTLLLQSDVRIQMLRLVVMKAFCRPTGLISWRKYLTGRGPQDTEGDTSWIEIKAYAAGLAEARTKMQSGWRPYGEIFFREEGTLGVRNAIRSAPCVRRRAHAIMVCVQHGIFCSDCRPRRDCRRCLGCYAVLSCIPAPADSEAEAWFEAGGHSSTT